MGRSMFGMRPQIMRNLTMGNSRTMPGTSDSLLLPTSLDREVVFGFYCPTNFWLVLAMNRAVSMKTSAKTRSAASSQIL